MRGVDLWRLLALSALTQLAACSVPLEDEAASSSAPDDASLPVAEGCRAFADVAGVRGIGGGLRSMSLPSGETLWMAEALQFDDGSEIRGGALRTDTDAKLDSSCMSAATADAAAMLTDAEPRDGVATSAGSWLYVARYEADATQPFGQRLAGIGIATGDVTASAFSVPEALLWTGDRPRFGSSAVVENEFLYTWGCQDAGFLRAECYLARAPIATASELSSYEYAKGGGFWTADIEEAWPLLVAGGEISMARLDDSRVLLAYAEPLGETVVLRSGLSVQGPWSRAVRAARCPKPDPGAFCGRIELHPELGATRDEVVLSFALGTFEPRTDPDAYLVRMVRVALPDELP
ncbi:MAG: hypothetical protein R3B13_19835 [Polyangiaceae bacterium]